MIKLPNIAIKNLEFMGWQLKMNVTNLCYCFIFSNCCSEGEIMLCNKTNITIFQKLLGLDFGFSRVINI